MVAGISKSPAESFLLEPGLVVSTACVTCRNGCSRSGSAAILFDVIDSFGRELKKLRDLEARLKVRGLSCSETVPKVKTKH